MNKGNRVFLIWWLVSCVFVLNNMDSETEAVVRGIVASLIGIITGYGAKMTYIKFKGKSKGFVMKLGLVLVVILSCFSLQGCSQSAKINTLKDQYEKSGDSKYAYEAIDEIDKIKKSSYFFRAVLFNNTIFITENRAMISIGDLAFRKKDYKAAVQAYSSVNIKLSNEEKAEIEKEYAGNDVFLNSYIAQYNIDQGNFLSAYRRLEKAALENNKYATVVKYLLKRFGCMDTDSIWAELTGANKYKYFSVNDFKVEGEDFPPIPKSYDREKETKMRIDLRSGKIPELQADCPLHKFN